MIRRYELFLLTVPLAAVFSAAPAAAQDYSSPPPGYYREAAPPGSDYDDHVAPHAFWSDDDEDDQPVHRPDRGLHLSQVPQGQPGSPNRILPYPEDAEAAPPPAFAPPPGPAPVYGHQLDQQGSAGPNDPNVVRPPGAIGPAQAVAPGAQPPPPAGAAALPPEEQPEVGAPKELAPNLRKQMVTLSTKEPAGTIIVDTANTYLYLVLGGGKAIRYGVRVGREGFTWSGTERISKMKEWPDWFPPPEMIERQPYLPRVMAGGPGNPLGARAMYLGNTLYRIHGTNQPSTIGHYVSSGCVGMLNEDVEDLYSRVQVGTRVVVLPGKAPETVAADAPPPPANPMAPPQQSGATISASPLPAAH
jgi:lipoprotein-anchoring transpeptidase ErfK/SrfK